MWSHVIRWWILTSKFHHLGFFFFSLFLYEKARKIIISITSYTSLWHDTNNEPFFIILSAKISAYLFIIRESSILNIVLSNVLYHVADLLGSLSLTKNWFLIVTWKSLSTTKLETLIWIVCLMASGIQRISAIRIG